MLRRGAVRRKLSTSVMHLPSRLIWWVSRCSHWKYVQGTSRDWQTATSLAITLVWTTYATVTLIGGIYWKAGGLRAFSLGLLVITVGKVFLVDVWHLETVIRVFAFISLGVALLLVSFLYRRYRERIRSWIVPTSRPAELDVVQPNAERSPDPVA